MAFTYCSSCGTKIEFSLQRPNFCTNCGEPLNGSVANGSSKAAVDDQLNTQPESQHEQSYKGMTGLQYEFIQGNSNEITIGNTVGGPSLGELSRKQYKSKTGNVMKDIKEDCQSSKLKDIDEIEKR